VLIVCELLACGPLFTTPLKVSMPTERKYREEIVRYGRMLHERGFVAAMDGNLSVRLSAGRILVTPTALSKGSMRAADMVVVDLEGQRVSGHRNVTSEIGMHLLIYRMREDVQAIVHAHPPTATGFAAAGIALTEPLVCEVVMGLGCIPLARYGTPGTSELAQTLEPYVPSYDAILMSNHGVVTYGDTLEHAHMKMETVEHLRICWEGSSHSSRWKLRSCFMRVQSTSARRLRRRCRSRGCPKRWVKAASPPPHPVFRLHADRLGTQLL
jgi:L-fuculose-phosphate aldolase